jgi:hypothetical protein
MFHEDLLMIAVGFRGRSEINETTLSIAKMIGTKTTSTFERTIISPDREYALMKDTNPKTNRVIP